MYVIEECKDEFRKDYGELKTLRILPGFQNTEDGAYRDGLHENFPGYL